MRNCNAIFKWNINNDGFFPETTPSHTETNTPFHFNFKHIVDTYASVVFKMRWISIFLTAHEVTHWDPIHIWYVESVSRSATRLRTLFFCCLWLVLGFLHSHTPFDYICDPHSAVFCIFKQSKRSKTAHMNMEYRPHYKIGVHSGARRSEGETKAVKQKKARNLKAAGRFFYGLRGHGTWKIRFAIFWPWLLHERGVSQLFHLTTVLENANFSCFAKNWMCGQTANHIYSESSGKLPYAFRWDSWSFFSRCSFASFFGNSCEYWSLITNVRSWSVTLFGNCNKRKCPSENMHDCSVVQSGYSVEWDIYFISKS